MLLVECVEARERRQQADLVGVIAAAYGGCKSKDGNRAMQALINALRQRD